MKTSGTALMDGLREVGGLPEHLQALGRPERLRSALNRAVPGLAEGSDVLEHVKARRIRIRRDTCSAEYEITVAKPEGERQTLPLRGVAEPRPLPGPAAVTSEIGLGEEGWRCTLPELGLMLESAAADPALPALPILTDPSQGRAILERALASASPALAEIRIRTCRPAVVRYKQGSRCTIIYGLDYAPEHESESWPDQVIAKVYRGDKGLHSYQAMRALWGTELGRSPEVDIAEPLAYLPELRVLIQGPVRGTTLAFLVRQTVEAADAPTFEALGDLMRTTARGLRALHRTNVDGEPATWEDELGEVRQLVARVEPWVPGFGAGVEPLLARIEALEAELEQQSPVASHRSFRPAQVLVDRGRVGFIDFDGFCRAEPAMDLALFVATVREVVMRGLASRRPLSLTDDPWLDRTDHLCKHFLDQYEQLAPVSIERVELWEALFLLTKALHCWTKVRPERLEGALVLLERHLQRSRVGFE